MEIKRRKINTQEIIVQIESHIFYSNDLDTNAK